jgi:DNA polymerase elongation subunit (family B)
LYQNLYIERTRGDVFEHNSTTVHLWDDKLGYESYEFENYAYKKDSNGDRLSIYGDKVSKVNSWSKWDVDGKKIFESDVPIETRVLVDRYGDSDDISKQHTILFFDIEVEVTDGLPDVNKALNKITAISFYDSATNEYYVYVLDEENIIEQTRNKNEEIIPFSNEGDLLSAFINKWSEIAPTIITGWNVDGFDVPYLYTRVKRVLGDYEAKRLSPLGIVKYYERRGRYFIAGVSSLDYIAMYKKFTYTNLPSYTLDAVARHEVNDGKVVNPYSSLNELKKKDPELFIAYSLQDTKLVVKIDEKMNFIDLVQGIAHKGHVPYEDVFFSSRWIEGAMLTYMGRHKLVAPNKDPDNRKHMHSEDKFSGAYVKDPQVGRHEWIYDLDFTSLYPSIVMTLNISPETKVGKIDGWNAERHLNNKDWKYEGVFLGDEIQVTGEDLAKILKEKGLAISANGVMYRVDKKGIIPQILEEWFKDKENFDKLQTQYGNKGDKEKEKYYAQRRTISKVMLNSVYGVLGLPVFRFYDIDNAEAVTTTGVNLIQYTEKMGNYYYNQMTGENDKDYCIYIDTDSVFFPAKPLVEKMYPDVNINDPEQVSDAILRVTSQVQDFLNGSFNMYADKFLNVQEHKFDIKQEVVARAGFWTTKKRYALWIVNKNGVPKDDIAFTGLDVKRSSFPTAFKTFSIEILGDILKGVSQKVIDEKIIKFKEMVKVVTIEDIATPTSVHNIGKFGTLRNNGSISIRESSKPFGNWVKGTPAHVKAAISYNELIYYYKLEKKYPLIATSEKVKWLYLKDNGLGLDAIAFKGDDDPPEILDFINQYVDRNKMFAKVLESKLQDFYDALKWLMPSFEQKKINKFFEL